uniref:PDZ domain-containing protein n=1 Tax=Parascaris equorum TaxID=6256 RepID=A0A914S1X6_PAREQ
MHEYEEVNLDEQFCVATQTDPVSSDEEDRQISEHMDDCFEGECELNALEYEEVVLKRSSSCHRLGLTLCYGATDDNDTDIFISEICHYARQQSVIELKQLPSIAADWRSAHRTFVFAYDQTTVFSIMRVCSQIESGSIADRDGRLRAGDQILQVNGEAIHSRLDAIEQFRSNRREISILLARTPQVGFFSPTDLSRGSFAAEELLRLHICERMCFLEVYFKNGQSFLTPGDELINASRMTHVTSVSRAISLYLRALFGAAHSARRRTPCVYILLL